MWRVTTSDIVGAVHDVHGRPVTDPAQLDEWGPATPVRREATLAHVCQPARPPLTTIDRVERYRSPSWSQLGFGAQVVPAAMLANETRPLVMHANIARTCNVGRARLNNADVVDRGAADHIDHLQAAPFRVVVQIDRCWASGRMPRREQPPAVRVPKCLEPRPHESFGGHRPVARHRYIVATWEGLMKASGMITSIAAATVLVSCASSSTRHATLSLGANSPAGAARTYLDALARNDVERANQLVASDRQHCPADTSIHSQVAVAEPGPAEHLRPHVVTTGHTWRVTFVVTGESAATTDPPLIVVQSHGRYFVC